MRTGSTLFFKIYATMAVTLIVVALASALYVHFGDAELDRGWAGRRDAILTAMIPANDAPGELRAALGRLGPVFDADITVFDAGGRPLAQRLHDKPCRWGAAGLGSLIPGSIAQGLIGAVFNCPDMIGGGDVADVLEGESVDPELFVRFAQCSALFPMMQFSQAPWRVLDTEHLAAVRAAVELRQSLLPELMTLVRHAAQTGEPILRPLAYHHPGHHAVHDQFLLGEDLLVAPVLEKRADLTIALLPPQPNERLVYHCTKAKPAAAQ